MSSPQDHLHVAQLLLREGCPVIVCRPHVHGMRCHSGCKQEFEYPRDWQTMTADQAQPLVADFQHGLDALGLVTGHKVDGIDVDAKNGADVDAMAQMALDHGVHIVGRTATPTGGAHFYVPSTGIASASHKKAGVDFRGGCADGTGRGFLYLPGSSRPRYRGMQYTVTEPIALGVIAGLDVDEQRAAQWQFLHAVGIQPRLTADTADDVVTPALADFPIPDRVAALLVPVQEGSRSEPFHWIVHECRRSGLTQAQTATVLGSWSPGVEKYGSRLGAEVARSWAKFAQGDAGAQVGGNHPVSAGTSDRTASDSPGWHLNAIDGNMMVAKRMKYLWEDRIPVGAITLAPGEEGVGKSTVCMRIAADLTRGTLQGEFLGTPRHVIVVAPEDGLYDVAMPRIQQAGADMGMVTFISSKTLMVEQGLVEDALSLANEDLKLLADLVREKKTALIVFDSFVSMMPNKVDARSYKDVNVTLAPLKRFAEQNRVAILAPWHLNKSSGSDTALRMMDSRAFRTGPRSVLLMVAVPGKPNEGLIALDKVNARDLRSVPAIRYRIRSSAYQVEEVDEDTGEALLIDATCGVADFIGEEPGFGRDNARAMLDPDSDRNSTIQGWLRDYMMSHGESLASEVLSAAESAGFSRSAIYRANRALGVQSREEGIAGKPPKRRAWWSLPEPAS